MGQNAIWGESQSKKKEKQMLINKVQIQTNCKIITQQHKRLVNPVQYKKTTLSLKKEKGCHVENAIKQWKINWESQQTVVLLCRNVRI